MRDMKRVQDSWALFRVLPLLIVGSAEKSCLTSLHSLSNAIWVYFSEVSKNSCSHSLCQCPCARLHMQQKVLPACLWECVTPALDKTSPLGLLVALGNPKERGESCSVIPEEGKCVPHPTLPRGWHIQGFLGRKKCCSPFTHPRHRLPAPEWWRMVSHGVMLVGQLESLPAIIQLQMLKSLGQRQFSLLYLFCGGLKSCFKPQSTPTGQTSREAAALQGAKPESACEEELLRIGS